jgi:hypothetical protein
MAYWKVFMDLLLFASLEGHWLKGVLLFLCERSCTSQKEKDVAGSLPWK